MDADISLERLREVLAYDPSTGIFTWKARVAKNTKIGARAGSIDPNGYRYIRINKRDYIAQRLAWFYVHGVWPTHYIRLENGDKDDCRIANLRDTVQAAPGKFDHRTAEGKSAYGKAWRAANVDICRERELVRRFGITLEEYQRLLVAQNGVCAICGQPERSKRNGNLMFLAVDHHHSTNKVRGLLCSNCNPMIGYAQEDPDRLLKAVEYLRRHNGG